MSPRSQACLARRICVTYNLSLVLLLRLLLGCLAAAEFVLRGEIGLVFGLGQALVLRGLIGGQLGLAGPLGRQGLGVLHVSLGRRQAVFELLAVLLGRLGQVLVRGEIDHQGHDHGDRRHQGRR